MGYTIIRIMLAYNKKCDTENYTGTLSLSLSLYLSLYLSIYITQSQRRNFIKIQQFHVKFWQRLIIIFFYTYLSVGGDWNNLGGGYILPPISENGPLFKSAPTITSK